MISVQSSSLVYDYQVSLHISLHMQGALNLGRARSVVEHRTI